MYVCPFYANPLPLATLTPACVGRPQGTASVLPGHVPVSVVVRYSTSTQQLVLLCVSVVDLVAACGPICLPVPYPCDRAQLYPWDGAQPYPWDRAQWPVRVATGSKRVGAAPPSRA